MIQQCSACASSWRLRSASEPCARFPETRVRCNSSRARCWYQRCSARLEKEREREREREREWRNLMILSARHRPDNVRDRKYGASTRAYSHAARIIKAIYQVLFISSARSLIPIGNLCDDRHGNNDKRCSARTTRIDEARSANLSFSSANLAIALSRRGLSRGAPALTVNRRPEQR